MRRSDTLMLTLAAAGAALMIGLRFRRPQIAVINALPRLPEDIAPVQFWWAAPPGYEI